MNIKKVVITNGIYLDKELRLLVSFDEFDKPIDLINLDVTKIGEIYLATVEKVLSDVDGCILKLDANTKGFIDNKKLIPDSYILRHSDKKKVCQEDQFYVQIYQDRKGIKPYSCNFIKQEDYTENTTFIKYYLDKYCDSDTDVITDTLDVYEANPSFRFYNDDALSLWNLYGLTKLLDNVCSRICHLKSGGNIVIEPTEALTVIDVNSGKNYGKQNPFEVNVEALEVAFREIRLRSISGIILIDLLKVSKEEEEKLVELANNLTTDDISRITIHGFSNLGLLEITRSKIFSTFTI
jgi:ribonuclease G